MRWRGEEKRRRRGGGGERKRWRGEEEKKKKRERETKGEEDRGIYLKNERESERGGETREREKGRGR